MGIRIGLLAVLWIVAGAGVGPAGAGSEEHPIRPIESVADGQSSTGFFTASPSPVSSDPASLPSRAGQDCDGARPSSGTLKSLLGRLVRASGQGQGVQCPIPSADEAVPPEGRNQEREAP